MASILLLYLHAESEPAAIPGGADVAVGDEDGEIEEIESPEYSHHVSERVFFHGQMADPRLVIYLLDLSGQMYS